MRAAAAAATPARRRSWHNHSRAVRGFEAGRAPVAACAAASASAAAAAAATSASASACASAAAAEAEAAADPSDPSAAAAAASASPTPSVGSRGSAAAAPSAASSSHLHRKRQRSKACIGGEAMACAWHAVTYCPRRLWSSSDRRISSASATSGAGVRAAAGGWSGTSACAQCAGASLIGLLVPASSRPSPVVCESVGVCDAHSVGLPDVSAGGRAGCGGAGLGSEAVAGTSRRRGARGGAARGTMGTGFFFLPIARWPKLLSAVLAQFFKPLRATQIELIRMSAAHLKLPSRKK